MKEVQPIMKALESTIIREVSEVKRTLTRIETGHSSLEKDMSELVNIMIA